MGPTQNRVLRLADEFGIKTHLTNEDEDMVYYTQVCISTAFTATKHDSFYFLRKWIVLYIR